MLKMIKSLPNLIPNLSKLEKVIGEQTNANASVVSKYRFNTVSYIGEYSFNTKVRTKKDYRKIKEELGFKLLTEEDMQWIDENVKEIISNYY